MRAALVLVFLACACGRDPEAPSAGAPSAASLVRLWTLEDVALAETRPEPAREAFVARFDDPEQGWTAIVRPGREPGGLEARTETADGEGFLRLSGPHGGLHALVPVEPETCYVFSGRVRTNGLAYAGDGGGATFWLGEARAPSSLAELVTTRVDLVTGTHPLRGTRGTTDWHDHRLVFVTAPETRWLHVVASLADEQTVSAGSADFAAVALARGSLATFWHDALDAETAKRVAIDAPEGWQRERRVSAQLGMEHRPSFVVLPGERMSFDLPPLARHPNGGPARLVLGVGPWRPALSGPSGRHATLRVECDGRELAARRVTVGATECEAAWEDVELELGPEPRTLAFRCEGAVPLAVGGARVSSGAPRADRPNVLLVSIDTLRADHVGAYAEGRGSTPTLDRLAREGVLCRDASAVSPYTLPSHTTMLTGQLPSVHGVVDHGLALSAARSTSLAEVLARAGYATQAFTSGGFVNAEFGLDRGFDGFAQVDPVREVGSHYFRNLQRRQCRGDLAQAERLLDAHGHAAVKRWIRDHAARPFFLFLHTYAVHDYDPPERYLPCDELGCARPALTLSTRSAEEAAAYTPEMRAHVVHLYDAALRYTDDRLAEILAVLDETGQGGSTLVVVTSDHGEEFFERGHLQHGRTLYEELLRVPLILFGAGLAPRVVERPVSIADVTPTVLARLGLPPLPDVQGVDVLGPAWPERWIWAEVDDRFAHLYALRTEAGRKALHFPGTPELLFPAAKAWEQFDLTVDPREQHDLAGTARAHAELEDALVRYRAALEELGERLGGVARGNAGDATLRELEGLGYGGLTK